MTRAAPRIVAGSSARISVPETRDLGAFLTIRWRIGKTGSILLRVTAVDPRCDSARSSGRLAAEATLRLPESRLAAPASSETLAGDATVVTNSAESLVRIRLRGRTNPIETIVSVVHTGTSLVILSDLPARLGLRGGTYVVEKVEPPNAGSRTELLS